jgi:hypothetical protein
MIHKVMEEFYVFVSSEDSLEHFGDYSGGQFRAQFPRTYPMKDEWECALLNVRLLICLYWQSYFPLNTINHTRNPLKVHIELSPPLSSNIHTE